MSKNKRQVVVGNTVHKKFEPKSHEVHNSSKGFLGKLKEFYLHRYKTLFVMLMILSALAAVSVGVTYFMTGDFTRRDVSLSGGTSITLNSPYQDMAGLEESLTQRFPQASLNIRNTETRGSSTGIIVEASHDVSDVDLLAAIKEKTGITDNNAYSVETMGSSLGESFFSEMLIALLLAFACMGLVFQFYFRNWYGTGAALLSAFLDLFITLGIMNIIGMRLTSGGIAAYLMLIGYSIDTSILLSTKLLKERKGDVGQTIFGAMRTGLTMSAAGLAATGISFIMTNNLVLKQIMLILVVGLIIDVTTTWIGNVSLLRIYLEKSKAGAR